MDNLPNRLVFTVLLLMTLVTIISTFSFFHVENQLEEQTPVEEPKVYASPGTGRVSIELVDSFQKDNNNTRDR